MTRTLFRWVDEQLFFRRQRFDRNASSVPPGADGTNVLSNLPRRPSNNTARSGKVAVRKSCKRTTNTDVGKALTRCSIMDAQQWRFAKRRNGSTIHHHRNRIGVGYARQLTTGKCLLMGSNGKLNMTELQAGLLVDGHGHASRNRGSAPQPCRLGGHTCKIVYGRTLPRRCVNLRPCAEPKGIAHAGERKRNEQGPKTPNGTLCNARGS